MNDLLVTNDEVVSLRIVSNMHLVRKVRGAGDNVFFCVSILFCWCVGVCRLGVCVRCRCVGVCRVRVCRCVLGVGVWWCIGCMCVGVC